ncbi:MAG: ComEC/Rec2 family competence protein [Candidatus Paceibacterota bacterium]
MPRKESASLLKENPLIIVTIALIVLTAFLYYVLFNESTKDTLVVSFLDVGQGDAIYIEAPNGNQMLIDGSRSVRVTHGLSGAMPFWDRSINVVLATHPDADHIGGLPAVIGRYSVGSLLHSGVSSESSLDDALLNDAEVQNVRVRELRSGDSIRLSPRVHFDVLFPPVDPEGMDPNDASIVGRLVYGDTAFLLSGDAPKVVERYIARTYRENIKSNVLKVGHHGSDTSTALSWLGWSQPEYAVISAGEDNSYGHPHQEVLDRLAQFGIEVVQTAKVGTVTFESDGKEVRCVTC